MTEEEYLRHDATALAAAVKAKDVTPEELLGCALARAEKVNPSINAIIHRLDDRARKALAAGLPAAVEGAPFRGVPFVVKDLDGLLAGAPFEAGSRAMKGYVATESSRLMERIEEAGLVLFGKTNTPEVGLLGTTEPEARGPSRNPWNLAHITGGSSGGSGAAVAAGIVPMAHGGDGGGSIRIPASACGLFGFKPSRGRVPLGPQEGEGWGGFVVRHVLSRSVRDSAAMLDWLAIQAPGEPYAAPPHGSFLAASQRAPGRLRIGWSSASLYGKKTDPACVAAVESAAKQLAALGHDVEEVTIPVEREAWLMAYLVIVGVGTAMELNHLGQLRGRPIRAGEVEPTTWTMAQLGRTRTAIELGEARETCFAAGRKLAAFQARYDLLLTPTLAYPPAKVGEQAPKPADRVSMALLRNLPARALLDVALRKMADDAVERIANTMLFNQTGQPAMSVPLHWSGEGLPIGVQLVGRYGEEETLFSLAGQLEQAHPWFDRRPPL